MRVKRGVTSHAKHKKLRAQTKGYSLVRRALAFARPARRSSRPCSTSTATAATRSATCAASGSPASTLLSPRWVCPTQPFMGAMKKAGIMLDRKILAELAVSQPQVFQGHRRERQSCQIVPPNSKNGAYMAPFLLLDTGFGEPDETPPDR
jgi:large subunit ribosomal protein L20